MTAIPELGILLSQIMSLFEESSHTLNKQPFSSLFSTKHKTCDVESTAQ
jgi:hypothetical protein